MLASRRPPCIIDGLDERNYGDWEGRVWGDIADRDPDFDRRWRVPDSRPPGGESRLEMHARVHGAMDSIVASHAAGSELLIVAHGGSGKAVLGYANKMSIDELFGLPAIQNAALTIFTRDGDGWNVARSVLPDEEVAPIK